MWIIKSLFKSLIFNILKRFSAQILIPSLLFMLLVIECIGLHIYTDDLIGVEILSSDSSQITDVVQADDLPDGDFITYYVTVQNTTSQHHYEFPFTLKDEAGSFITECIMHLPYEDTDGWAGCDDNGFVVPAGTQMTYTVLVEKERLKYVYGQDDTIVFSLGYLEGNMSSFEVSLPQ